MESEHEIVERIESLLEALDFNIGILNGGPGQRPGDITAVKQLKNDKTYGITVEVKTNKDIKSAIKNGIATLEHIDTFTWFDKLLLVILDGNETKEKASQIIKEYSRLNPTKIEIITFEKIENWVINLKKIFKEGEGNEVIILIRNLSKQLIELIAKNPRNLMNLDWRDLERTIYELFEGFGFYATLTPPSKDGGKDIILECQIKNQSKSFIIEIKHWRSQQKVGKKSVKEFTKVIINEGRDKGLFLSTYGYTQDYYEFLTSTERSMIGFGEQEKIVELCQTFEKIKNGIYLPVDSLEDLLFKNTK
ncbi:MAG TPA: restriction endonuclease [Flavobacterium sp.]|jgi:restriction endonuclease Mrr